jgi:predicted histone-like DNA-binding protein
MGKINYSLVQRRNPAKKDAPKLYYASAQKSGDVTFKEIKESIAHSTTATAGDVSLVLESLLTVIKEYLKQGRSILLDQFGNFRLSFSSKGVATMKEFSTEMIKNIHILFRPCKELKAIKNELSFEQKMTKVEQVAALKNKVKNGLPSVPKDDTGKDSQPVTGGETKPSTGGETKPDTGGGTNTGETGIGG